MPEINNHDKLYSIWLMEYATIPDQPIGSILYGSHNRGTRSFPMGYFVVQGAGHVAMVDVGTSNRGETSRRLQQRDHFINWRPAHEILAKIDLRPEDVDTVILTHAHFDHMDILNPL